MISFTEPGWFALFLAFPLLVWARFLWRRRGGRLLFPFRIWGGDGFRPPGSWKRVFLILTDLLFWAGAVLLIIALAGPEMTEREEVHLSRGIDIMLVLDQSPGMAAEDFPRPGHLRQRGGSPLPAHRGLRLAVRTPGGTSCPRTG